MVLESLNRLWVDFSNFSVFECDSSGRPYEVAFLAHWICHIYQTQTRDLIQWLTEKSTLLKTRIFTELELRNLWIKAWIAQLYCICHDEFINWHYQVYNRMISVLRFLYAALGQFINIFIKSIFFRHQLRVSSDQSVSSCPLLNCTTPLLSSMRWYGGALVMPTSMMHNGFIDEKHSPEDAQPSISEKLEKQQNEKLVNYYRWQKKITKTKQI